MKPRNVHGKNPVGRNEDPRRLQVNFPVLMADVKISSMRRKTKTKSETPILNLYLLFLRKNKQLELT
jgi:hypothetical protein